MSVASSSKISSCSSFICYFFLFSPSDNFCIRLQSKHQHFYIQNKNVGVSFCKKICKICNYAFHFATFCICRKKRLFSLPGHFAVQGKNAMRIARAAPPPEGSAHFMCRRITRAKISARRAGFARPLALPLGELASDQRA